MRQKCFNLRKKQHKNHCLKLTLANFFGLIVALHYLRALAYFFDHEENTKFNGNIRIMTPKKQRVIDA